MLELDDEARRQIIHDLPSVFCKRLEPHQIDLLLQNQATCNPLFLLVALEELRVFGSFDKLPKRIADLPRIEQAAEIESALDAVFGQVLNRLERETHWQTPGLVATLFRLLASAREGLSEQELSELLARQFPQITEETRNGAMHIVLRQLRRYLMRKGTEQTALIDFYHRSFWKAVRAKYLPDARSRHDAHQTLAEYFDDQPWWLESLDEQRARAERLPATPRPANLRKVTELPAQRFVICREAKAGELAKELEPAYHQVEQLFTKLEFLEAKNEGGLVFDLPSDFRQALEILPEARPKRSILKLLDEALHRDIYFIARHAEDYPQALFQCLWNACWWYDCPEAALHYVEPDNGWTVPPPWDREAPKLCDLMDRWRAAKEANNPGILWLRCLCPPQIHLNTGLAAAVTAEEGLLERMQFSTGGDEIITYAWKYGRSRIVFDAAGKPSLRQSKGYGTLQVWNVPNGQPISSVRSDVSDLAVSPNDKLLATAHGDKMIRVWHTATMTEKAAFTSGDFVNCLVFSPTGDLLAGSIRSSVRLWNVEPSWSHFDVPIDVEQRLTSIAISTHGSYVACGFWNGMVCVYDIQKRVNLLSFRGHERRVLQLAFSSDGNKIISVGDDGTVGSWNASNGAKVGCIDVQLPSLAHAAFSSSGEFLAHCSDHSLEVWDVVNSRQLLRISNVPVELRRVAISSDARLVAVSMGPGLWIWPVRPRRIELASTDVQTSAGGHDIIYFMDDGALVVKEIGPDFPQLAWNAFTGRYNGECWYDRVESPRTPEPTSPQYKLVPQRSESRVIDVATGKNVAYFPLSFRNGRVATHPTQSKWAACLGNYVCILDLEKVSAN